MDGYAVGYYTDDEQLLLWSDYYQRFFDWKHFDDSTSYSCYQDAMNVQTALDKQFPHCPPMSVYDDDTVNRYLRKHQI